MTDHTQPPELLSCPFCGEGLVWNGSMARHPVSSCIISKFTGPIIEMFVEGGLWKILDADRWNTRAAMEPAPEPRDAVIAQLVEAMARAIRSIENGGGGGVSDVVWLEDATSETVCDHLNWAINAAKAVR